MSYLVVAFIIAAGFVIWGLREIVEAIRESERTLGLLDSTLRSFVQLMDKPTVPAPLLSALRRFANRTSSTISIEESEGYKKGLDDGTTLLAQLVLEQLKVKETTNA